MFRLLLHAHLRTMWRPALLHLDMQNILGPASHIRYFKVCGRRVLLEETGD